MPHYPPELYVARGRRMVGEYVFSEWMGRRATGAFARSHHVAETSLLIGE